MVVIDLVVCGIDIEGVLYVINVEVLYELDFFIYWVGCIGCNGLNGIVIILYLLVDDEVII